METMPVTPRPSGRRARDLDLSRWSGAAYVALLVTSLAAFRRPNLFEDSPQEYVEFYGGSIDLGWTVLLPGLSLIAFLWALARLRAALPPEAGGVASALIGTAGGLFAAAAAGVAATTGGAAFAVDHVDGLPTGDVATIAIVLDSAGEIFFVIWLCAAAALVWAVALAGRRAGVLPSWIVWGGFVLVPVLPLGWLLFGLPMLLFLVWLATVTAIVPLRR